MVPNKDVFPIEIGCFIQRDEKLRLHLRFVVIGYTECHGHLSAMIEISTGMNFILASIEGLLRIDSLTIHGRPFRVTRAADAWPLSGSESLAQSDEIPSIIESVRTELKKESCR